MVWDQRHLRSIRNKKRSKGCRKNWVARERISPFLTIKLLPSRWDAFHWFEVEYESGLGDAMEKMLTNCSCPLLRLSTRNWSLSTTLRSPLLRRSSKQRQRNWRVRWTENGRIRWGSCFLFIILFEHDFLVWSTTKHELNRIVGTSL